ncbi:lysophospholipid acyltransferase family protein [Pedobacter cryoconitis]|uniref:KDO2-lipid IV(A) lauroyltransferase n=1 Tax=Pedobacter cryoconitis TaxID=188932 RepID=A0A7X0MKE8_9SPHI|nr:lysophospholipid acyltransferase family protein [Pedobacter cryoconitis]MBB6501991.1 KDO2-lipid IV(A) lauroyltransferase [Pedobacter cryoconitis]
MNLVKNKIYNPVYHLVYLPIYLVSLLPSPLISVTLGQFLYFISYRIFRYRYNVVLQNLSRSLPAKSYAEIQQIAKEFYKHLACMIMETLKLFSVSLESMDKKVTLVNPELLHHYHQQNRNIIAVLGHYGNWEYLNILPAQLPFKVNAIYKPLSSQVMDKLVHHVRGRFGMRLLASNQALRYLLKQKDQPQLSIFLADQFPGDTEQVKFDFLHQSTSMFNGAEKLAKATNAVVVYLELKRKPDNCWEIGFSLITESPKETSNQEITKIFAGKLQQTIKGDPTYWLWSHRRWKY